MSRVNWREIIDEKAQYQYRKWILIGIILKGMTLVKKKIKKVHETLSKHIYEHTKKSYIINIL